MAAMLGAAFVAQPLVSEDVLEPSLANEAAHALDVAATNAPPVSAAVAAGAFAWTNGLSRTAIAVRLVSSQRADGRWLSGTNDVTSAACTILKGLR